MSSRNLPGATPSAQAMHLLCCMRSSLNPSFYDKRQWSGQHPLEDCVTENLRPLDPRDPGLELMARLSGKVRFEGSDLMKDLRQDLYRPLWSPVSLLDHAHALLQLKQKPGGWLQVEAIWEHFTGASLTNAQEHLPINEYIDPASDFTDGCRYSVESIWYQEADDDQYYHNQLPEMLFGNDLASILSRLEIYAERCDELLMKKGQTKGSLEGIGISIRDEKGRYILSLHMPDQSFLENRAKPRFDITQFRIHSHRYAALAAIRKAYGQHGFLAYRGKEFTLELGV